MVRVGDLVQRTGDGHTGRVLGGRTIRRSGDTVCDLYSAQGDMEHEFLGRALKPRSMVCQWFGLKITGTVYEWFGLKTTQTVSPYLASKSVVWFFLVWPQNLWR
jgi:hypothetical protein